LTTILANTDIDIDAGITSRVALSGVDYNGTSGFVVAWYDSNDTTIKAAVYNASGSQVTAPFNITTDPSIANLLLSVTGSKIVNGIGLCNYTFAIAYTNSSEGTVFETYFLNGTLWDGTCGSPPNISAIAMTSPIILNAGSKKLVECNLSIQDLNGATNLELVNATLYHVDYGVANSDNALTHYTNTSCIQAGAQSTVANYTCTFDVTYFALNGTWYCFGFVRDVHKNGNYITGNTTLDPLYALNITSTIMDFGNVSTGEYSNNITQNISNIGNQPIKVSVYGYGSYAGDNNSFTCPTTNLSVGLLKYSENSSAGYDSKTNLSDTQQLIPYNITAQTNDTIMQNSTFWQMYIPTGYNAFETCTGNVVFQAEVV